LREIKGSGIGPNINKNLSPSHLHHKMVGEALILWRAKSFAAASPGDLSSSKSMAITPKKLP
jgi:hypothetical protein